MSIAVRERDERDEGPDQGLDLRILTPGLTEEEIAAVTSVVTALIEAEHAAADLEAVPVPRWQRSLDPGGAHDRGRSAWAWSAR